MTPLLRSLWLLATRLLHHLLTLPFRPRGGPLLLRRFAPDALIPLSTHDLEMIRILSRCDGCGLCDTACAMLGHLPAGSLRPSDLVLSLSRSLPVLDVARADLEPFLFCGDCRMCRNWCPKGIPLDQVPYWSQGMLVRLDRWTGQPGPGGPPAPAQVVRGTSGQGQMVVRERGMASEAEFLSRWDSDPPTASPPPPPPERGEPSRGTPVR